MKLNTNEPIICMGNPNTCKTNLCVYLARQTKRKLYALGYPKKIAGFINLSHLDDIFKITKCTLFIDEVDAIIDFTAKRDNNKFRQLLKFAYHNNIKLICNTQISQFINKTLEALIPCWAITEIDIFSLKNGSKPKRIIQDTKHNSITAMGMSLPKGRYIWYNMKSIAGENGIRTFPDQHLGKAWKNATNLAPKTATKN